MSTKKSFSFAERLHSEGNQLKEKLSQCFKKVLPQTITHAKINPRQIFSNWHSRKFIHAKFSEMAIR